MSTDPPPVTQSVNTQHQTNSTNSNTAIETHFESALKVVNNEKSKPVVKTPIKAKALLGKFTVSHTEGHTYEVKTNKKAHTTDREAKSCSCPSTLPRSDERCTHLELLEEMTNRQCLPTPSETEHASTPIRQTTQANNASDADENTETNDGKSQLSCPDCGKDIGYTNRFRPTIGHLTCSICALNNPLIYYLERDPDEPRELVRFDSIPTNTIAKNYYHNGASMSTYELFADHPKTKPNDPVTIISRRLPAENSTGLLFETETIAVPSTVLTKAMDTMDSTESADDPTTTQPDSREQVVVGYQHFSPTSPVRSTSQNRVSGAASNE